MHLGFPSLQPCHADVMVCGTDTGLTGKPDQRGLLEFTSMEGKRQQEPLTLIESRVRQYFDMWITRDFRDLDDIVAPSCVYEECYGPIYRNRNEIHQWIADQLTAQVVTAWEICGYLHVRESSDTHEGHIVVVTWTFAGREKEAYVFDGCSIIAFDELNRMIRVREFQATHVRKYPYESMDPEPALDS